MKAEFQNPYSASEHNWSYGFLFRDTRADGEFRLAISSDKSWSIVLRDDEKWTSRDNGSLGDILKTGNGQSNTIYLIVSGKEGYFFLNKKYITTLDLSDTLETGDICVGTGMSNDDEVDGKTTQYSDFTLWSLP